jgi:hypothetical protein
MALDFPRDIYAEMWLGAWVDVRSYLQQTPITLSPGRSGTQSKVSPVRLAIKFNDPDGDLDPNNPDSPYYGLFRRNVPFRMGLEASRDAFSRTVSDGWGTADSGETWTIGSATADYDVGSGIGTQFVASGDASRLSRMVGLSKLGDAEVIVDINVATPATNDSLVGIVMRGRDSDLDHLHTFIKVTSAGVVSMAVADFDPGSSIAGPLTISPGVTNAEWIRLHAMVSGQWVYAKAYNVGDPEPFDWMIDGQAFGGSGELPRQGWPGLRFITDNAANLTAGYDNWKVRIPRFTGEIDTLVPRWNESHKVRWVEAEAGGPLGRIQSAKSPVLSTYRRAILLDAESSGLAAYWPLEDGEDAAGIAAGIANVVPGQFAVGRPKLATNDDFASSAPLPEMNKSSYWMQPSAYAPHSPLSVVYLVTMPATPDAANGSILLRVYLTGSIFLVDFVYGTPNGTFGIKVYNQAGTLILDDSGHAVGEGMDGHPKQIILNLTQDGADVDWQWWAVDPPTELDAGTANGNAGTLTSHTFGAVYAILTGINGTFTNTALGHVSVHSTTVGAFDYVNPLAAYPGERAMDRFNRLCEQDGIRHRVFGLPEDTPKMGPQRMGTLSAHLEKCSIIDGGPVYEDRCDNALVFRGYSTTENQDATLTLDYSARQVAGPLLPSTDLRDRVNVVTVKREGGGQVTLQQTSGPLNINEPWVDPDGIGPREREIPVNAHTDDQIHHIASQALHDGTNSDERFPKVRINMAASQVDANLDVELSTLAAYIDDRIVIENMQAARRYEDVTQLAVGYTETFDTRRLHDITFNTIPEDYRHVPVLDPVGAEEGTARAGSDAAELYEALTTTQTTAKHIVTDGTPWTIDSADFPFPLMIAGERVTATANVNTAAPSFVGVGTAAHANNASVTPGLPAGQIAGDTLIMFTNIRDFGATASATGWTPLLSLLNNQFFYKISVGAGEVAPTVNFTGGPANASTSAQIAAFRNLDPTLVTHTNAFGSSQNVVTDGFVMPRGNAVIIWAMWRQDDHTSVATLTGLPGIAEIGDTSTTLGDDQGMAWDYLIQLDAIQIPGMEFVVTGGASAFNRGIALMLANPQEFTFTRSVNGVVKAHTAGTQIRLADRTYLGRGEDGF